MKLLIEVIALLVISAIVMSIAIVALGRNPVTLAQGELRCQGGGAIIINIDGKDYAVNGMASPAIRRYKTFGTRLLFQKPIPTA